MRLVAKGIVEPDSGLRARAIVAATVGWTLTSVVRAWRIADSHEGQAIAPAYEERVSNRGTRDHHVAAVVGDDGIVLPIVPGGAPAR